MKIVVITGEESGDKLAASAIKELKKILKPSGKIVGATQVVEDDQVMLISDQGTLVRTSVSEISVQGRNTQGVRLIAVRENERLVGLERVVETDDDSNNGDVE